MIDAKYQALNDEIMAIREQINQMMPEDGSMPGMPNDMSAVEERLKAVEEKLSNTPGAQSIKKPVVVNVDDKFNKDIERIKAFSKVKPISKI